MQSFNNIVIFRHYQIWELLILLFTSVEVRSFFVYTTFFFIIIIIMAGWKQQHCFELFTIDLFIDIQEFNV